MEFVGGQRGLAELLVAHAVPDADRLRELRRLRSVRDASQKAAISAERGDLSGALEQLSAAQSDALNERAGNRARTAGELAHLVLRGLSGELPKHKRGIHLGLRPLHDAFGELKPGSVLIVGADTNVGKSSFTLEMLLAVAQRGDGAGFIGVEDPEEITGERLLAAVSGVSASRLHRRQPLSPAEWQALSQGTALLERFKSKLMLADLSYANDLDVCAEMSRMAAQGIRLIAVDYIGEIESSKRAQDRRNEIRLIIRQLKSHAKRLGIALVIVSQLNRPKDAQGREPTKHDLKESGDLENGAEAIVVLWRTQEDDFVPVHCKVAKSKIGGNGIRWNMQRERYKPDGSPGSGRLLEVP